MIDDLAIEQAAALPKSDRPLLICDIDEVVLHFVEPFSKLLVEYGYYLRIKEFKLSGNVFDKATDAEIGQQEIWRTLGDLFEQQSARQPLIHGVFSALGEMDADIEIVFLTNMPHQYSSQRRNHLDDLGLEFPMITNTGSKGPVVEQLINGRRAPTGFIDDTPHNLKSVHETTPDTALFHFMANDEFRKIAEIDVPVEISTGDWGKAKQSILRTLVH